MCLFCVLATCAVRGRALATASVASFSPQSWFKFKVTMCVVYCGSFFRTDSWDRFHRNIGVHRQGDDLCWECSRGACARFPDDGVAAVHRENIRTERSAHATRNAWCLSLCVGAELSVAPIITTWTSSRPPSEVNYSRISSDTPIPCWEHILIYHVYCTACLA